jgi:putative ABC transport system permease protein
VAAVIAVVTFVNGINGYVAEKIFNLGADVFIMFKVSPAVTNVDHFIEGQKRKDLTMDDYRAVREGCNLCAYVGAYARNNSGHVKYGERALTDTMVQGMTPSVAVTQDIDIDSGRMLGESDLENNAPVAIVGTDIVDNLMPGVDPLGKEIRVDGWIYRIIGVGKKKGSTLGQSLDNYVLMPMTAWTKQHGSHNSNMRISAKAVGTGPVLDGAMDEARVILRSRRHDPVGSSDSFDMENNSSLLSIWANLTGTFFVAMIGIAAISMVVGGIVIMNIMLVSVTERTREVGIRKAMGARRSDVLLQFLIEAVILSLAGGIVGVLLGIAVAKGVTLAVGMPSVIKLWAVMAGLIVSASVGIFFGVYPARKAATLDPIAALRFET